MSTALPPLLLGVNIDHIATLRQARYRGDARTVGHYVEPDCVFGAQLAEQAGADGITVHLREDRRHIQPEDVHRLRTCVRTHLNLEMACTPEMVAFALEVRPDDACLVPEKREEVTTEGGLDVVGQRARVAATVAALKAAGITASLFIDPTRAAVETAAAVGAPVVELHTGAYAHAWHNPAARARELETLRAAAVLARQLGLVVNAGHGLNYQNIAAVASIPELNELNIGHSIISRAVLTGLAEAVREMKRLLVAHRAG